jgi:mTERF domain-containing protein
MLVRSIDTVSTSKLSISNVFHVPKLFYNLLSVGQLAELSYRIILDYFGCVVQDPRTGQELGTDCRIVAKAIIRNPSLLTYDFHNIFKPAIALYDEMGVSGQDLIPMLLSRPTMIPRTSFDEEKMEYIRKTGISKESKMYKYVVTLIGVSCHETIRLKVMNLEKFCFSNDEIFNLFRRSPFMLTLSVDKVQRNMTFILGMMKFPASVVLQYPFPLYSNLKVVLRP